MNKGVDGVIMIPSDCCLRNKLRAYSQMWEQMKRRNMGRKRKLMRYKMKIQSWRKNNNLRKKSVTKTLRWTTYKTNLNQNNLPHSPKPITPHQNPTAVSSNPAKKTSSTISPQPLLSSAFPPSAQPKPPSTTTHITTAPPTAPSPPNDTLSPRKKQ